MNHSGYIAPSETKISELCQHGLHTCLTPLTSSSTPFGIMSHLMQVTKFITRSTNHASQSTNFGGEMCCRGKPGLRQFRIVNIAACCNPCNQG